MGSGWRRRIIRPRDSSSGRAGTAPHLKTELRSGERRVWCEVAIQEFTEYPRPANQGGKWLLAERMRIIRELN